VLALANERHWVDTQYSYNKILDELKGNLGIHPNLDSLRLLDLLHHGVKLLTLQKKRRAQAEEVQRAIEKLNERP